DEQTRIHAMAGDGELTRSSLVLKLPCHRADATLGSENSVFEPTSPPSGFDNPSLTSCPQCGGRRKVHGEDLIIRLGFTKPSPDRIFEPRGSRHGARSFVRLSGYRSSCHRSRSPAGCTSTPRTACTIPRCRTPRTRKHSGNATIRTGTAITT